MADHITVAEAAETLTLEVGCTNPQKTAPGQQDGAGGLAIRAWSPEFNPKNSHKDRRRKLTPNNAYGSLTSIYTIACMDEHSHMHAII